MSRITLARDGTWIDLRAGSLIENLVRFGKYALIVNLYVDHMMAQPATSSDDVLAATQDHPKLFAEAARKIGLTSAEYREFRTTLLDGNAMYVRLPRRVDAMSANHHGNVYVVKNAVATQPTMSWRVPLRDGNVVYVPQICGNISLVRHSAVAMAPHHPKAARGHRSAVVAARGPKATFVPSIGEAHETLVAVTPPAAVVGPAGIDASAGAAPVAAPASVGAVSGGTSPFVFAIPAVFAAVVAGAMGHHDTSVPGCDHGSNLQNACQK